MSLYLIVPLNLGCRKCSNHTMAELGEGGGGGGGGGGVTDLFTKLCYSLFVSIIAH